MDLALAVTLQHVASCLCVLHALSQKGAMFTTCAWCVLRAKQSRAVPAGFRPGNSYRAAQSIYSASIPGPGKRGLMNRKESRKSSASGGCNFWATVPARLKMASQVTVTGTQMSLSWASFSEAYPEMSGLVSTACFCRICKPQNSTWGNLVGWLRKYWDISHPGPLLSCFFFFFKSL